MMPPKPAAEDVADEQPEPPDEDPDVAEADPTGRYLRYREIIGSGSSKTVYKAFDAVDGIEVAWGKVEINERIMGSSKELQRLRTEIQLLKSLQHKHILKLYASWVDTNRRTVNIVTELFTSGNLRDQKPPIIHRDLKCDNIFINGNHGKVKIGDFGLAMVMQQRKTRSIQGTIEFMAPELFGENYNELVDIYSFGMCMLEMVTCECPYSECKGFIQIYKKITEGVKPAALSKVKDAEVRGFIDSCLASVSDRLPANELLKSPFLQSDDANHRSSNSVQEPVKFPENNFTKDEPIFVSLAPNNGTVNGKEQSFILVLQKSDFLLEGNMSTTNPVMLFLRFPGPDGKFKNVQFPFDMEKDTSLSVSTEMVEQLELPEWNNPVLAELIDAFLLHILPSWKPCVKVGKMLPSSS
uniref:non-specific serine/threonine protein kinase n=1 Tax=Oryza barthii TaxID=65489 RepID=A0A0D3HII7_9ORYZ